MWRKCVPLHRTILSDQKNLCESDVRSNSPEPWPRGVCEVMIESYLPGGLGMPGPGPGVPGIPRPPAPGAFGVPEPPEVGNFPLFSGDIGGVTPSFWLAGTSRFP